MLYIFDALKEDTCLFPFETISGRGNLYCLTLEGEEVLNWKVGRYNSDEPEVLADCFGIVDQYGETRERAF